MLAETVVIGTRGSREDLDKSGWKVGATLNRQLSDHTGERHLVIVRVLREVDYAAWVAAAAAHGADPQMIAKTAADAQHAHFFEVQVLD